MGRDTIQLEIAVSTISQEYLPEFTYEYDISEDLHPELPGPEERIVDFSKDMDLFNLIRALNPTKVKIGTHPRAAHEVPFLTVIANRVIEIEVPTAVTESFRTPSTIERDRPVEEIAAIGPRVIKKHCKRGNDGVDANAPPKVLRKDHADSRPTQSTIGGKWLASMGLETGPTFPVPTLQETPADISDSDPLSFANSSSKGAAIAGDPKSEYTSFTSVNEIKNLEALLEAEADMKKVTKAKNAELVKELENLRAQFTDLQVSNNGCLSRRWVIGHGLRLAVIKCGESTEQRQVFADVVSTGIAKGMSEGLKYGLEHVKVNLDLEAIEAYDSEADTKYVTALHALRDLKYPMVDQLESLKDALIDVIMASLHLESDSGEDAPQCIRELRPSSSQLKIPVYPEKKKCRVVCRTHGVGSAHHARSNGVLVSVPIVAPQGLAILLADAATQTETSKNEVSLRLLRSKSLPSMYNLDWP
nr:hypothetical protein [Tanacetum cinerariifolium]